MSARLLEHIGSVLLASTIGVALAAVLVQWWAS